jgi:hypothetical protein
VLTKNNKECVVAKLSTLHLMLLFSLKNSTSNWFGGVKVGFLRILEQKAMIALITENLIQKL